MLKILDNLVLDEAEIHIHFIRSPGPGGQNVNKVATTAVLRFNVVKSNSLSENIRMRLLMNKDKKLTTQGEIIIKASRFRTQERNKQDALKRLLEWMQQAATPPKKRKKTKPTYSSKQRRLTSKKILSKTKSLRRSQF